MDITSPSGLPVIVSLNLISPYHPAFNRTFLTYASDFGDIFLSLGTVFYFDHKGRVVPVWVSEQGIGRGLPTADISGRQDPRDRLVTHIKPTQAMPHYITPAFLVSYQFRNIQYSTLASRLIGTGRGLFKSYERPGSYSARAPEDLIMEYTCVGGTHAALTRMDPFSGAVVGLLGRNQPGS